MLFGANGFLRTADTGFKASVALERPPDINGSWIIGPAAKSHVEIQHARAALTFGQDLKGALFDASLRRRPRHRQHRARRRLVPQLGAAPVAADRHPARPRRRHPARLLPQRRRGAGRRPARQRDHRPGRRARRCCCRPCTCASASPPPIRPAIPAPGRSASPSPSTPPSRSPAACSAPPSPGSASPSPSSRSPAGPERRHCGHRRALAAGAQLRPAERPRRRRQGRAGRRRRFHRLRRRPQASTPAPCNCISACRPSASTSPPSGCSTPRSPAPTATGRSWCCCAPPFHPASSWASASPSPVWAGSSASTTPSTATSSPPGCGPSRWTPSCSRPTPSPKRRTSSPSGARPCRCRWATPSSGR